MPFVSARDPRTPSVFAQERSNQPGDSLYNQAKYADPTVPMAIASGMEARLIEAEAALHEPNPAGMLNILNTLRASVGLADLTLPTTTAAQVDLLYHERAFWLYLTGRRLGDLRRLVSRYGRDPETVFPTGEYPAGGLYGSATAIPFSQTVEGAANPHITHGCSGS